MTHTYDIKGMHCRRCESRIKSELLKLGDVTEAAASFDTRQAVITMQKHIPVSVLNGALSRAGDYTLTEAGQAGAGTTAGSRAGGHWLKTYQPLLTVFGFILLVSVLSSFRHGEWMPMLWMNNFMAGFFIAFSFFKLLDLRGFADSYRSYDLLARRLYVYGWVYPFIELALGLFYLTGYQLFYTNLVTILVMGFSLAGVFRAVLQQHPIRCACLGTVFNLPMSTVTITEDLLMLGMALYSILFFL